MPQIDLQGVYPNTLHDPIVLTQSHIDPNNVYPLLFDTGLTDSSICMFDRDHRAQHTQFTGGNANVTISLAAVGGVNPVVPGMPQAIGAPAPAFARAVALPVKRDGHACAISHQYLLTGPSRLVAWWSIAPAVQRTPVTLPAPELTFLRQLFGQPALQVYAVPISFADPTNAVAAAAIPAPAPNEVALSVDIRHKGIYTQFHVTAGGQVSPPIDANVDSGASYTVVHENVARFLGLATTEDANVVIPQIDFPNSNPALSLLNVPAVVTRDLSFDMLTIGSSLLDLFSQVVFDLDPANNRIRLLP